MKNYDIGVLTSSKEYFHIASQFAKKSLFYLISGGDYQCNKDFIRKKDSETDSFYVMLIQKGALYIEMEHQTYMASKGTLVLLNNKTPSIYYAKTEVSMQWIQFSGVTVQNFVDLLYEMNGKSGPVFQIDDLSSMAKKFDFIINMYAANQINEFLGSLYLHDILTSLTLAKPLSSESTDQNMIEVAHYIDRFYNDNLTVKNLAKGCNLCVYYFIRAFQKVHKCTPYQYLANVRFEHAKRLLRTTNMNVEEIGKIVGFSSGSNFARSFKKEYGYSPTAFRNSKIDSDETCDN